LGNNEKFVQIAAHPAPALENWATPERPERADAEFKQHGSWGNYKTAHNIKKRRHPGLIERTDRMIHS
jgi:hypothetical protein